MGFGGTNKSARPENLIWDREPGIASIKVFTDGCLKMAEDDLSACKVAVMLESPAIRKREYEWIEQNAHIFDKVLTFKRRLVEKGDPFCFYFLGGSWIPLEEWGMHKKWRNISILVSDKNSTEGHKLRHSVLANFANVEPYGEAVERWILDKGDALKDYRYCIVIENTQCESYGTEKIVDAISVGTIPIYWGCPNIGNFFNLDGIVTWDTISGLSQILPGLGKKFYNDRLDAIKENMELALQYRCPDDTIYRLLP